MTDQYLSILIFIIIAVGLSSVIVFMPFVVSQFLKQYEPSKEKQSIYECGFDEVKSGHTNFNIKFYLVGILFLVFDLEIAFLFPWALILKESGSVFIFSSMMIFLMTVTVGFVYEWRKGALDWS